MGKLLERPSARPVVNQIQDFLGTFPEAVNREKSASRAHEFLTRTQERIVLLFAKDDEEAVADANEGLERFVYMRLYGKVFGTDPTDAAEDARLQKHIDGLRWVDFQHLGSPPVDSSLLSSACLELRRMDSAKAPRDKIGCVLTVCRVINEALQQTHAL